MASHSQSRGRKRRRGRKEEEGASGEMASAHMSHSVMGPTAREIMRKSQVCLSYFSLNLNSVFYLCELGSQNRYAPLTHKPDNRAPFVSSLCLGSQG
jgi:hypothetical protein